jgi:hypothetical protein
LRDTTAKVKQELTAEELNAKLQRCGAAQFHRLSGKFAGKQDAGRHQPGAQSLFQARFYRDFQK